MHLSEEDVVVLRADLERAKREVGAIKAKNRECETELERLQKERSLGTSFDGQCGHSTDRRGTAASTMGPMWTRGVRQQQPMQQPSRGIPTVGGDGEDGSSPLSETFFGGDGGSVEE